MNRTITPGGSAKATVTVPGDKSISIRAVLFSSIADGVSRIRGVGTGGDVQSAIRCIKHLGIPVDTINAETIEIHGKGLYGYKELNEEIDCGNSGTTLRLLSGILAGQKRPNIINGDESLQNRPMKRIIEPLRKMGADINAKNRNDCAPLMLRPASLRGITYDLPVASAQVKSAILLASLYAEGQTTVIEPEYSRNHTELLLQSQGVKVTVDKKHITLLPVKTLNPINTEIPGDISGAAFFIVLASILKDSSLIIGNIGVNQTRSGIIDVLKKMGADISLKNRRTAAAEPVADLEVKYASLHGIDIYGDVIPRIIDEIPVIAVAAAFAQGKTHIRDAAELRVKETDRIKAICTNLKKMGVDVEEQPDGMVINGGNRVIGAEIDSYGDHRIAMAFAIAGAAAAGETTIIDSEWADISFPRFFNILDDIRYKT